MFATKPAYNQPIDPPIPKNIGAPQDYWIQNSRICVGRYTYGHDGLEILQWGEGARLTIGAFCSIAAGGRVLLGGNHRLDWATTFPFGHIFVGDLGPIPAAGHPATKGDVVIGNDVWLGSGVTIMSGISIGDGAVVAANATVVKNIGPYEVWGGNPAVFVKHRFEPKITDALLQLCWWNLSLADICTIAPLLSRAPTAEVLQDIQRVLGRADPTIV